MNSITLHHMKTLVIVGANKNESNKSTLHPCRTIMTFLGLEVIYHIMSGHGTIIECWEKKEIHKVYYSSLKEILINSCTNICVFKSVVISDETIRTGDKLTL